MSRDQRPGRVSVVDAGPAATPARRSADTPAADSIAPAAPDSAGPTSHALLWSVVFLSACIAGAVAVTLRPLLGTH